MLGVGGVVWTFGFVVLLLKDLPHLYLNVFTSDSDLDLTLNLLVIQKYLIF